jgi:1-deoxyxylulose-5-phosphate synthase
LKTRRLGNSELYVSEIAYGSWLTVAGGIAREQAERCIHAALDAGITLFDTANEYGRGAAEAALGETLHAVPRDRYLLATKLFFPMSETDRGLSAAQVAKQLDASLVRLRTDYVDLYQCHRYDEETPLEETMAALTRAVEAGKTRAVGFSGWTAAQIDQAAAISNQYGYVPFVSSQPQYSMLWRKPEAEIFPTCERHGIGQIVFSPLAQGVLSGKYKPGLAPPADSRAADPEMNMFMQSKGRRFRDDDLLTAVQQLVPIANDLGITLSQMALAWVLRKREVAAAIIGGRSPEQIRMNVQAAGLELPADVIARADAILAAVTVT